MCAQCEEDTQATNHNVPADGTINPDCPFCMDQSVVITRPEESVVAELLAIALEELHTDFPTFYAKHCVSVDPDIDDYDLDTLNEDEVEVV